MSQKVICRKYKCACSDLYPTRNVSLPLHVQVEIKAYLISARASPSLIRLENLNFEITNEEARSYKHHEFGSFCPCSIFLSSLAQWLILCSGMRQLGLYPDIPPVSMILITYSSCALIFFKKIIYIFIGLIRN